MMETKEVFCVVVEGVFMLHCPPQQGCPYGSDGTELPSVYRALE